MVTSTRRTAMRLWGNRFPAGVHSRNFSNERIYSTGWHARFPLVEGIKRTYPWIEAQVKAIH